MHNCKIIAIFVEQLKTNIMINTTDFLNALRCFEYEAEQGGRWSERGTDIGHTDGGVEARLNLLKKPLEIVTLHIPNPLAFRPLRLEARVGIEPTNEAFAEPCLTTWLPRHHPPIA